MSDAVAEKFSSEKPVDAVKPEGRSVTLSITLPPNGQIEFSIPTNKVLAHGLLGAAQEQLIKLSLMQEAGQAKAARGGIDGFLKRMNGG